MQNKIAENFDENLKNLDKSKQITNQIDDYLEPHNDMEGQDDLLTDNYFRGHKRRKTLELRFGYAACHIQDFGFKIILLQERMSKLDQFADKHLRGMAKFNINCSDPGERKACGE